MAPKLGTIPQPGQVMVRGGDGNESTPVEQRVINPENGTAGPRIGEYGECLPATYALPDTTTEKGRVITGLSRTDR